MLSPRQDLGLKIAAPVGIIIGKLFLGWLAGVVARKQMCRSIIKLVCLYCSAALNRFALILDGFELTIMIFATFAQAISADGRAVNIIAVLIVWRFLVNVPLTLQKSQSSDFHHRKMGVGIGGD